MNGGRGAKWHELKPSECEIPPYALVGPPSNARCSPTPAAPTHLASAASRMPSRPASLTPTRLRVTVCHYPSGASKWNPIDHRLFSEISKNWAGHPLRCYQAILNDIRTTTTDTGLCVSARLVDQEYPRGVEITHAQFASIALARHQVQPLRNRCRALSVRRAPRASTPCSRHLFT